MNNAVRSCQCLLLLALTSLSGCGGCQPEVERLTREERERRALDQREALVLSELLSLPTDSDAKILIAKPGHWLQTQQQFKSNREDMQILAVGSILRGAQAEPIPGTDVINRFTRRTSLPQGQTKTVAMQYFVPPTGQKSEPYDTSLQVSNKLEFLTELLTWPALTPILAAPQGSPARALRQHEFQLAVLSPQTLGYEFLNALDAISWRGDELVQDGQIRSYWVTLVKAANNEYAFPNSMLTMTALAVLIWDDVSADDLSLDQQQAIIDWIHWGGQLIVSGPSSWSRLQTSFLSPYLPTKSAIPTELETADFAPLSAKWSTHDRTPSKQDEHLTIGGTPIGGLRFILGDHGAWLPDSGELVAESAVGRGRIVLTSFPLREPRLYRWKYFSSFLSTGLLRRPPRTIELDRQDQLLTQVWAGEFQSSELDPRLHSNFRILSRDLPLSTRTTTPLAGPQNSGWVQAPEQRAELELQAGEASDRESFAAVQDHASPTSRSRSGGVAVAETAMFNSPSPLDRNPVEAARWGANGAAWNDYSGLSLSVLSALKSAAGIELPSRRTIVMLLVGYLTCLVPVNWLVFRILGRLELAWVAVPGMAIVGVIVVTKVARLDIGFARRTTEISLLEMHGEHPRGHLTQYLALYTSLSTNYAIDFPDNGSVALPMADLSRTRRRAVSNVRNIRTNYGRSEGVTLEPLTVYSNSTEMLHAEQMVNLQGVFRYGSSAQGHPLIRNETGLPLQAAIVVRRTAESDAVEVAWVGALANGQTVKLDFAVATEQRLKALWSSDSATAHTPPKEDTEALDALWIGGLLHEVAQKTPLVAGQSRLIAYTDERAGDLRISPKQDQFDGRCVVVAHLTPPLLGGVTPDESIMSRVASGQEMPHIDLQPEDSPPEQASNL